MKNFLLLIPLLFAFAATAQTNEYYYAGELDIKAGASVFVTGPGTAETEYGYTVETVYWQTIHTGTGLELGDNHFQRGVVTTLNYSAVTEYYRITPWPQTRFFNRFDIYSKTAAETWYDDGSKGATIGGGIDFAFTKKAGLNLDFAQHFDSIADKTGEGLKLSFAVKF